jgi:hypothetical protein
VPSTFIWSSYRVFAGDGGIDAVGAGTGAVVGVEAVEVERLSLRLPPHPAAPARRSTPATRAAPVERLDEIACMDARRAYLPGYPPLGMPSGRCVSCVVAAFVVGCALLGTVGRATAGERVGPLTPAFVWLVPEKAPAGWKHVQLASGAGVLSYPAFLRREKSDPGSITAVTRNALGLTPIYVNVTPRQGDEQLATWPAFRMAVLRAESAKKAHEASQVVDVAFDGGFGSCVLDDYVTRIGSHHYEEIACYVQGAHGGSVLVASTFASLWQQKKALLEQVVASYRAT